LPLGKALSVMKNGEIVQNRSWKLEDAQKIADEFPYTFHKPSKEVVSQLKAVRITKTANVKMKITKYEIESY
jgi:hypothetical protein